MKLGKNQTRCLLALREFGTSDGWVFRTNLRTRRILDRLVELGLARDEGHRYVPTEKHIKEANHAQ